MYKETEEKTLKVYLEENPSTHDIEESREVFQQWEARKTSFFRDKLRFPPKMFADTSLLDLGAGTGDNSVFFGLWGATCTLVDMNPKAIERAKFLFDTILDKPGEHRFIVQSLFEFQSDDKFDIALSNGVLHITGAPEEAFYHLASFVKAGGYLVLGIGNNAGSLQAQIRRFLIYCFADTDDEIVDISEKLFKEHIDRAEKIGRRSRRAVIFDSFVNPKLDFPSVAEVLAWFKNAGLRLYSSYPPITPPILGDSWGHMPPFDETDFPWIGAIAESAWMMHDKDDVLEVPQSLEKLKFLEGELFSVTSYVNDFQRDQQLDRKEFIEKVDSYMKAITEFKFFDELGNKSQNFLSELTEAVDLALEGNLEVLASHCSSTEILFRGTGGLGMNNFVGYLPKEDE